MTPDRPPKGRALRRALETRDAARLYGAEEIPLIVDTSELIDPERAQELLLRNTHNRPINWAKVEEYAAIMARGEWRLIAQGLVLDGAGNILTGQTRLWGVIYANTPVWFRVSRGNPPATARLLDRGRPQSARDLATRGTGRRHSPTEASLARGVLVLKGDLRPSTDALADMIETLAPMTTTLLRETQGTRKTRAVLMILAAICSEPVTPAQAAAIVKHVDELVNRLERALSPQRAETCWGRGAAFSLAMERARAAVRGLGE